MTLLRCLNIAAAALPEELRRLPRYAQRGLLLHTAVNLWMLDQRTGQDGSWSFWRADRYSPPVECLQRATSSLPTIRGRWHPEWNGAVAVYLIRACLVPEQVRALAEKRGLLTSNQPVSQEL